MSETKRGRGRPRTQEVIDRDEAIFQAVAGSERAVTKYEISEGTGVPLQKVYTSLRRMSQAGKIFRVYVVNKQHYWSDRSFEKPLTTTSKSDSAPQPTPEPEIFPVAEPFVPPAVFSSPE